MVNSLTSYAARKGWKYQLFQLERQVSELVVRMLGVFPAGKTEHSRAVRKGMRLGAINQLFCVLPLTSLSSCAHPYFYSLPHSLANRPSFRYSGEKVGVGAAGGSYLGRFSPQCCHPNNSWGGKIVETTQLQRSERTPLRKEALFGVHVSLVENHCKRHHRSMSLLIVSIDELGESCLH